MTSSHVGAALLVAAVVSRSAWCAAAQPEGAEGAKQADAGRGATRVALISVPLPLSGNTDQQIMASADRALKSMPPGDARGIMVFEFRPSTGDSVGSTPFERALSLARFLAGDQFNRVRTIAYVPLSLEGHAVLPVLACEEIVIHPDARFGAAGSGERTIDATLQTAYREMANRRRTIPVAVVLGMLDPNLTVVEAQLVGGGSRYVLSDELESLRGEAKIWKESAFIAAGELASLTGAEMRRRSFASHLAADRQELANALGIAPELLRDNVSVEQSWRAIRIDVQGRISTRTADDVTRAVRDAQRLGTANLICLRIDSPGGQAAPALRIVQLLAGLDSRQLRSVAFVEHEARSVAALVALSADETHAAEGVVLGGPGDTVLAAEELAAMRQPIQELARARNRDWSPLVGLVDPEFQVVRCRHVDSGTVRYFSEEERASQTDPGVWKVEGPLALDDGITAQQALDYGWIAGRAESLAAVLRQFHIEQEVAVAERHPMVRAIEDLATQAWLARTLLFIAFFALISEASTPGIGVAGFVSGLCFLLFFWCQFLNGTAGWLELILFLGGLTCIALEIFVIPGIGVFGIGGGAMMLASIVLASQTFVFPRNAYQMEQLPRSLMTLVVACAGVMSAFWFMRRFLAESWLLRRLTLTPPAEEVDLDRLEAIVDWAHLCGSCGVTTTQLTPSGKARFGDDVVNVISDGVLIPRNSPVRVVQVRGNCVLVESLEGS